MVAAEAVVCHAFGVSRLERLRSRCFLGNEPSRCLLVALGFTPVGVGHAYAPARQEMVTTQEFELGLKQWRLLRCLHGRSKTPAS